MPYLSSEELIERFEEAPAVRTKKDMLPAHVFLKDWDSIRNPETLIYLEDEFAIEKESFREWLCTKLWGPKKVPWVEMIEYDEEIRDAIFPVKGKKSSDFGYYKVYDQYDRLEEDRHERIKYFINNKKQKVSTTEKIVNKYINQHIGY